MDIGDILQVLVNALMLGLTYALIALGLNLVFGVMRIVNFSHGEFYVLGCFGIYYLFQVFGINYFLALILSMIIVGLLGMLVERVFFRPLRGKELPSLIVSVGILLLIQGINLISFGEQDKGVVSPFSGILQFAGVRLPLERIMIMVIALILVLALHYFLQLTKIGRSMRAVAQDQDAAALQGINVNFINSLAFGIGCLLAAAAAGLIAPLFTVNPFLGSWAVMRAFIVMVLGGMGSIPGAILGGLILGFIESFGYSYIGGITEVIGFLVIVIVLLVKPTGLLGRE